MTVEKIITQFGYKAFQEYAKRAWALAAKTGHGYPEEDEKQGQKDYEMASDIVETIWESELKTESKISLVFQLYRKAPDYTWLSEMDIHYLWEVNLKTREIFWIEMRRLVSEEDDCLAAPACYLLWCGPFEDPNHVDEAWAAMTSNGVTEKTLQRLLINSGPVPYSLKRTLYEQLIQKEQWHYFIFRSLLHSAFDYYGQIDIADANRVLQKLNIPNDTEHLDKLKEKLELK